MQKTIAKKRGPKPLGERAMTPAERQRKRREAIRANGGRTFILDVGQNDLAWLELEAMHTGRPVAEILKEVLGLSLQRYGEIAHRVTQLSSLGASPSSCARFVELHAFPAVPPIEELQSLLN